MGNIILDWFNRESNNFDAIMVTLLSTLIIFLSSTLFIFIKKLWHKWFGRKKTPGIQKFLFDYSTNRGEYILGSYPYNFITKWTKCSKGAIYAYTDGANIDAIAYLPAPIEISALNETIIKTVHFDPGTRVIRCRVGDSIIWCNRDKHYAITKVISIKDNTRGDAEDSLECEYKIFEP